MVEDSAPAPQPQTAGALLRQAREAQGLHIAVLAARLKMPQRKLEALEADRLGDLPDAMFARALAQTVCRSLKVDAAPVLALLPQKVGTALDQVSAGLNTPFRDKPSPHDQAPSVWIQHPVGLVVLLLLVATAVVWFWPRDAALRLRAEPPAPASVSAPSAPALPLADAEPGPAASDSASTPPAASAASQPALPLAPLSASAALQPGSQTLGERSVLRGGNEVPLLSLRTTDESWVEVVDASGRTLVSRVFSAGDATNLDDGALPFRVVIGNVGATELRLRGQAVDLLPVAGSTVARLELK